MIGALLTACTPQAAKVSTTPVVPQEGQQSSAGIPGETKKPPEEKPREEKSQEPEEKNTPSEATAPEPQVNIPVQPQPPAAVGEKLDFEALQGLDNTKYAWWLTLNNRHETPGIPDVAKKLIEKQDGIYLGDTSKKTVYLTFDEGYENGYTPKILDTLKANDVKALFFVTGPYVKQQGDLIQRMLDEGHLVGNHTINHPSLPKLEAKALENELYGLEKQFAEKFNKGFRYMRPPMGEYSERVLAAAKQLGYKTVFWSFAYRDFETNNQKGADYAYKMVMSNLHNGAVILLHAVSKDNAEALDRIIKDIRAQGYTISPFDL